MSHCFVSLTHHPNYVLQSLPDSLHLCVLCVRHQDAGNILRLTRRWGQGSMASITLCFHFIEALV